VKREDPLTKTKPFEIPKRLIWESWKHVAANRGAPGVDKESIQGFQTRLGGNLYTLWNRMSSGSYHPKPVREVLIPKGDGKFRPLGIPTVADRVAQMVVKKILEPRLEALFHPSSYGYRPGKNAKQAVAQARRHCWRYDWVVDMDIRAFFDTIDHELMRRAVEKHVPEKWIRLYIERWLKCDVQREDGTRESPDCGTPQGGVISPILANLYLHYAFDAWMQRHHPSIPFERYADDVVCHCRSKEEADSLLEVLRGRLADCHLDLHPDKTRVVYCNLRVLNSYPEAMRKTFSLSRSCLWVMNFAKLWLRELAKRNSGKELRSAIETTSSEGAIPGRIVLNQDPKERQTSFGKQEAR